MIQRSGMVLFLLALGITSFAGGDLASFGGRSAAMGRASVISTDEWASGNNPAGLAFHKVFQAGIFSENRFLLKELSTLAACASIPVQSGAFGVIITRSGSSYFNEIMTGISYGRSFGKILSAGVRIHYFRIHMAADNGNKHLVNFSAGLNARAGNRLMIGIQVLNPVPVRILKDSRDMLPLEFLAGLSWEASGKIKLEIEGIKEMGRDPAARIGMEYHVAKPAFVRVGILTDPVEFTFGAGMSFGNFRIDLASSYHLVLGYSPQLSICYQFSKTSKE